MLKNAYLAPYLGFSGDRETKFGSILNRIKQLYTFHVTYVTYNFHWFYFEILILITLVEIHLLNIEISCYALIF